MTTTVVWVLCWVCGYGAMGRWENNEWIECDSCGHREDLR